MRARRKIVAGVAAGLAVAGGGAAVAATQGSSPSEESKTAVADAAKQLGVTPERLTDALRQALENRVDAAVEDGRLTQEQGAELKERIRSGEFPLLALGGHRVFGHGPFGHHLDAAAAYLGTTEAELRETLASGKTLAQAARDAGKSIDGLIDALVADERQELEEAVQAGRLTEAQKSELLDRARDRITAIVNGERPSRAGGPWRFGGPGHGQWS